MNFPNTRRVGAVAIGRNEGERLKRCLESLIGQFSLIVYVDSGSTDNSLDVARSSGAKIVTIDTTKPFSAGRARNAGFLALTDFDKEIEYVQFLDGDCRLDESWLSWAMKALDENPGVAVVCGRRREISRMPAFTTK